MVCAFLGAVLQCVFPFYMLCGKTSYCRILAGCRASVQFVVFATVVCICDSSVIFSKKSSRTSRLRVLSMVSGDNIMDNGLVRNNLCVSIELFSELVCALLIRIAFLALSGQFSFLLSNHFRGPIPKTVQSKNFS